MSLSPRSFKAAGCRCIKYVSRAIHFITFSQNPHNMRWQMKTIRVHERGVFSVTRRIRRLTPRLGAVLCEIMNSWYCTSGSNSVDNAGWWIIMPWKKSWNGMTAAMTANTNHIQIYFGNFHHSNAHRIIATCTNNSCSDRITMQNDRLMAMNV